MRIDLESMDLNAINRFLDRSRRAYIADQIASGVAAGDAERLATRQQEEAFPHGQPLGGHLLFDIVADGSVAGHLWLGPMSRGEDRQWWIWDVEVDEVWQGRGVGRAALRAAEHEVVARGGRRIGLQVFADNAVARHLYQTLGYREASLQLQKDL